MDRKPSIKLTSRNSIRRGSSVNIVRTFGFEESYLKRWECSEKLKQLPQHSIYRSQDSPIISRKTPAKTNSTQEKVPENDTIRRNQKYNEEKIHLLKELPWNSAKPMNREKSPNHEKSSKPLKRNVSMPINKSKPVTKKVSKQPSNKLGVTMEIRSLEDISFPPPPSPRSLRRFLKESEKWGKKNWDDFFFGI